MDLGKYNLAAAGATAAGGVISTIGSAIANKNSQKRQYKYNSLLQQQASDLENANWFKQYERQFNDQLKWRDDERLYNSPAAQMARMKEAGINPTFGNGGISAGNYSLNPEMPGTAASVGTPGVGSSQLSVPNFLGEGLSTALQERLTRVQEKKVGIEENLSKGQLDKLMAESRELIARSDLNDEQRRSLVEKMNVYRSEVTTNAAKVEQGWTKLLLDQMQLNLSETLGRWANERAKEKTTIGFIEANAAKTTAETGKSHLQFLKDKWNDELKIKGKELDNESERLLQNFEKNGVEALNKALDEATLHFKLGGFGFNYTSPDDLVKQIALVNAASRYFQNVDIEKVLQENKGWTLGKATLDAYDKFSSLLQKMSMVPALAPVAVPSVFHDFEGKQPNP